MDILRICIMLSWFCFLRSGTIILKGQGTGAQILWVVHSGYKWCLTDAYLFSSSLIRQMLVLLLFISSCLTAKNCERSSLLAFDPGPAEFIP